MLYPYKCDNCGHQFEVVKSVKEYKTEQKCQKCNHVARRVFTAPHLTVDKTMPEYNPAFGKVIKNKRERRYEAEKNGMVEIGNERPDVIHKEMDNVKEHRRSQRWDKVMKEL